MNQLIETWESLIAASMCICVVALNTLVEYTRTRNKMSLPSSPPPKKIMWIPEYEEEKEIVELYDESDFVPPITR